MGRTNGAAYLLQVSAPSADSNIDGLDNVISFYNMAANTAQQSYKHAGPEVNGFAGLAPLQFSDKLTYLTPKFNGFQAGASYSSQVDNKNFSNNVAGMQLDNDGFEDLMEIAARWDGEFSNVGVHLGAGYSTADRELSGVGLDDYKEWNAGAKLTWDAFGLGFAYNEDNGSVSTPGDNEIWVLGADYTWGAYKFGVSYMDSETEIGATEDELDR
jgi:outer membrane protein OmpU